MPSNDKLSDHERLIKISSGQPQNPHFLKQISADSRKLHPNFNIPIYHLHTNFRYLFSGGPIRKYTLKALISPPPSDSSFLATMVI